MRRRLASVTPLERIAWGVLLLAALEVRLLDLGDRPYHHDESQDAYFSWLFAEKGDYEYNPLLHPPLRFYLTAAIFKLLGDGDFTARLAPALMGTLIVALPLLLRRQLGRVAAFAAAVMLAFGPTFLYFSRFAREDVYLAAVNLALFIAIFRFVARPYRWGPAVIGALLAAAFATKEATFITAGLMAPFFVAWFVLERRAGSDARRPLTRALTAPGGEAWGWGVASFVAVYVVLFTTFLTDPDHWDALYEGLKYWWEQHGEGRGEKEPYFYAVALAGHEWPALALGTIGGVLAIRYRHPLGIFLAWMFVAQFAAYSYANERFTWLLMHPLLPLTLLAGVGVQAIWERRSRPAGRAGLALVAVCGAYVAFATWSVNVSHRADPREFLVTTQSAEDVPVIAEQLVVTSRTIARQRRGQAPSITIDAAEGATFPYAWYLREVPNVGYLDLSQAAQPPDSDLLVITEASLNRLRPQLAAYRERRFQFRVWWVRDYSKMTPGSFLEWLVTREPWNPTGGMPEWLLVKKTLGPARP